MSSRKLHRSNVLNAYTFVTKVVNKNNGNIVGQAQKNGRAYFYKLVPLKTMAREQAGYDSVRRYYPVATLHETQNLGGKGLLVYSYEHSLSQPRGMLSDVLDHAQSQVVTPKIIAMYRKAYRQTVATTHTSTHNIFFSNRVSERLIPFYNDDYRKIWEGKKVRVNTVDTVVKLSQMIDAITAFYIEEVKRPKYCVISQGDPAEYNLGTQPLLLDYDAGGHTPIMAEFATMLALTYFYGDFLARKYNPDFFTARGLATTNEPLRSEGSVNRTISPWRANFLRKYTDECIMPLYAEQLTTEQVNEFRNYFAMKVLAVFNISNFTTTEQIYLLGMLQYVYDRCIFCKTPNELTELLLWRSTPLSAI